MTLKKQIHNFRYALTGIAIAWREEFNFGVQVYAALAALLLGWLFGISRTEWMFVVSMIGLVLAAEVFNTALEELCDKFRAEHDPHIAKIKDLAAAAVLITSLTALVVGIFVFLPYFANFFS